MQIKVNGGGKHKTHKNENILFIFSSVTNSGWTVLNQRRNIQKPTALKWQFCPLCCSPKNLWCLAANRSCGKNSTSKNPLKVYRLPVAPMLVLAHTLSEVGAQAQTRVPLWLRRIKWDKPPYVISDATTQGACKGMQKLRYSKNMHYPRSQKPDQELQVVTWRSDYTNFQVISHAFFLQESSHKGLILENPKEELPTSRLCQDKTMYRAKEVLIVDLWSCFTIKANHQDQGQEDWVLWLKVSIQQHLRSCHTLVEGCQTYIFTHKHFLAVFTLQVMCWS